MDVRQKLIDGGASQSGPLEVDIAKTLAEYHRIAQSVRAEDETQWLTSEGFDAVLTDATPIACTAAHLAGIPSLPIVNFTWDLVYAAHAQQLGEAQDGPYHRMVREISRHYSRATLCIRLPGFSPMPAFAAMVDGPLVVRKPNRSRADVRSELGIADQNVVLITFGGYGAHFLEDVRLPSGWLGLCVGKPGDVFPEGFQGIELGAFHFPDLVASVDCIIGKLGYGMTSECLSIGTPLLFVPRANWMEEPFFKTYVRMTGCGLEMPFEDYSAGNWSPYLQQALAMDVKYQGSTDAREIVTIVERLVAAGGDPAKAGLDLSPGQEARLVDRAYWHHLFSPGANTDFNAVDVPEWYLAQGPTRAAIAAAASSTGTTAFVNGAGDQPERPSYSWQRYQVVEGNDRELELQDVKEFLDHFSRLADARWDEGTRAELTDEERHASELFRFSSELIIARAPGRLDVMGGIADYSGSLVLQLPLKEACLAALQLGPPSETAAGPFIRVVSYGATANHRGPAHFELPLSQLQNPDGGGPISYTDARALFTDETRWAAYIVGCLVVLMREERAALPSVDVSVLISSCVPEGKGVSSSAAVEVATMQALVAALGYKIHGRRLGMLCQMVENLVVGAPCGVMDQLASTLGAEGSLLALLCRPAEVQGLVKIPDHVGFWGIDSGARHCVSGADYGSVRAAAFMGLKMTREAIPAFGSRPPPAFLTQIAPSEFRMRCAAALPSAITGVEFTAQFGSHLDTATAIDPQRVYNVRACASHPVDEHQRVLAFQQILSSLSEETVASTAAAGPSKTATFDAHITQQLTTLGELMLESHASYSRCGLGSLPTDLLVELVVDEGRRSGDLFGAKITGGGSGGTVCVLGRAGARGEAAVLRVVERYKRVMGGVEPYLFRGSGPGASAFGTLRVLISE